MTTDLEKKINKLKFYFLLALKELNELTHENFSDNLATAKSCMQDAEILKNELKKEYKYEVLKPYEKELMKITKQIREKYDNIVESKKLEMARISERIRFIQNKKKLVNYIR